MSNKPNPFLSIWTKPRWTIEHFTRKHESDSLYILPFIFYGIYAGLEISKDVELLFDANPTLEIKIGARATCILCAIALIILILGKVQPWFIQLIGRLWNGKATVNQLGTVSALAHIPYILVLIYEIIAMPLGIDSSTNPYYFIFSYIIQILVIRITIIGISKAQKFGYLFALMNWLLSFLPILLIQIWITIIRS